MTVATRFFVGVVIAAGAVLLAVAAPREYANPDLALTWLAAMLTVSLFKLRLPLGCGHSTMSMACVVDFAVIVTAGADLAMMIAAAGVLAQCTIRVRRRQPWYRAAFSVAAVVIAVQAAGAIWSLLGGSIASPSVERTMIPLIASAVVYVAINTGLVAAAIALSSGESPLPVWHPDFVRTIPAFAIAAGAATAFQILIARDAWFALPAAAVPIVLCHLAYASWFRSLAGRTSPTAALT